MLIFKKPSTTNIGKSLEIVYDGTNDIILDNVQIKGSLVIDGDLQVIGSQYIDHDISTSDKVITLNQPITGTTLTAPSNSDQYGFTFKRGTLSPLSLLYSENGLWTAGDKRITLMRTVPDSNTIAFWNSVNNQLDFSSGLTYTGGIVNGVFSGVINKITLTQPSNGAVLTISDGKTLTIGNSISFNGIDGSVITFPATGSVLTSDNSTIITNKIIDVSQLSGVISTSLIPALSGDISKLSGSAVTTITNGSVTLSKMANIGSMTLLGNNSGNSSTPLALSVSNTKIMLGLDHVENVALSSYSGSSSIISVGTLTSGLIDYSLMTPIPTGKILGNFSGSTRTPLLLSVSDVRTGLSIDLVDNISLNSWGGSTNINTVGVLTSGTIPLARISTINNNTFLGNISGSIAIPSSLSVSQVKTGLLIDQVDNISLNSWGGSSNISSIGVLTSGTVPLARISTINNNTFLGNISGSIANPSSLSVSDVKTGLSIDQVDNISLNSWAGSTNITTVGTLISGNIPYQRLSLLPTMTILGNVSALSATPIGLTSSQVKTLINLNNVENVALSSWTGDAGVVTLGTINSGIWNAGIISPLYGGTGVNNGNSLITLGGNLSTVGAFSTSLTATANTNVILPITGTLATLTGTETLINKSISTNQLTGTLQAQNFPTLIGDIRTTPGTLSTFIGTGTVTLTKMSTLAVNSIIGNNTAGLINPIALTTGQVVTMLNLNNVENTALSTWTGDLNLTTLGTILTGSWNGSLISPVYGGTGVNNSGNLITLGGNLSTSGLFALTLTTTAATNVTLPTTGVLATLAGTETFTNKSIIATQLSGVLQAAQFPVLSGDVTTVGSTLVTTLGNGVVSLIKMTTLAANSIIGNSTASVATPTALSTSQVKTLLNLNNVENTALSTWAGSTNVATLGTVSTGVWNAGIISPVYGGTGINNTGKLITLGGNISTASSLATSGAFALTLTTTAATNVTLPTTGVLSTLANSETLSNKTLDSTCSYLGSVILGVSGGTGVVNTGKTITLGGNISTASTLTTSGLFALTLTSTAATNVTLPTTGILATLANSETFTNKTLSTGVSYLGNVISGQYGGTGVANTGLTITLGGNISTASTLTTSGLFALTLTTTAATNVTLPTTGVLATLAGTETFTNKSIIASQLTGTLQASQFPVLSGDVTTVGASLATTIAAGSVSLIKMTTLAANSIIGNSTASVATPTALSTSQVKTLLSINNVDNVSINSWAGSSNITTLGTLTSLTTSGAITSSLATDSTSIGTGSVIVSGGVSIANTLRVGGKVVTVNLAVSGLTNRQGMYADSFGNFISTPLIYVANTTQLALGGTDTRGTVTVQNTNTTTFVVNTDCTDAVRCLTIENMTNSNVAFGQIGLAFGLNPTGTIGTGRMIGDIRLVRDILNSSTGFFVFNLNAGNDLVRFGTSNNIFFLQTFINATTASTSSATGALIVSGGVGIGGNINSAGTMTITGGVGSTVYTNGTLVVTGGVGISGNTNIGGSVSITGGIASTSTSTGSLIITGGTGISGDTNIGGSVGINSGIGSTTYTNGALVVIGGVGISENLRVNSALNVTGQSYFNNTVNTYGLLNASAGILSSSTIRDNTDPSKQAMFDSSLISTGTTRSYIFPNANGILSVVGNPYIFKIGSQSVTMATGTGSNSSNGTGLCYWSTGSPIINILTTVSVNPTSPYLIRINEIGYYRIFGMISVAGIDTAHYANLSYRIFSSAANVASNSNADANNLTATAGTTGPLRQQFIFDIFIPAANLYTLVIAVYHNAATNQTLQSESVITIHKV